MAKGEGLYRSECGTGSQPVRRRRRPLRGRGRVENPSHIVQRLAAERGNIGSISWTMGSGPAGRVAALQFDGLALGGHRSDPPGWLAGAMIAPDGFSGVQPLPSAAASKSTDSRLAPAAPNIEVIT